MGFDDSAGNITVEQTHRKTISGKKSRVSKEKLIEAAESRPGRVIARRSSAEYNDQADEDPAKKKGSCCVIS